MPSSRYTSSTHLKTCFNAHFRMFLRETSEVVLLHVIYQDVTESKAGYIRGRGAEERDMWAKKPIQHLFSAIFCCYCISTHGVTNRRPHRHRYFVPSERYCLDPRMPGSVEIVMHERHHIGGNLLKLVGGYHCYIVRRPRSS